MNKENTRIKICCIMNDEDVSIVLKHNIYAVGFVSNMPSGPGIVDEGTIEKLVNKIPKGIATFLLTPSKSAMEIINQQKRCGVNTLQLCEEVDVSVYTEVRDAIPRISLVQVIHVTDQSALEEALRISSFVDAILLDTGFKTTTNRQLGGTGISHDWNISRQIREAVSVPIFLAGGLNADNIAQAIQTVQPFGVDVCSGVRTNGKLDKIKLDAFLNAAQAAV